MMRGVSQLTRRSQTVEQAGKKKHMKSNVSSAQRPAFVILEVLDSQNVNLVVRFGELKVHRTASRFLYVESDGSEIDSR